MLEWEFYIKEIDFFLFLILLYSIYEIRFCEGGILLSKHYSSMNIDKCNMSSLLYYIKGYRT